jgi:glycosyltransferase involved in cell wall biosynthesis
MQGLRTLRRIATLEASALPNTGAGGYRVYVYEVSMISPTLAIITATYKRPAALLSCIQNVKQQVCGNLQLEHIVVVDGEDDPESVYLATQAGVTVSTIPHAGSFGAAAKDSGLVRAESDFVVFWDDDNWYYPHAAITAWTAAQACGLAFCTVEHIMPYVRVSQLIPHVDPPVCGGIDTACFCVRKDIAELTLWYDGGGRCCDWRWAARLMQAGVQWSVCPIIIAKKLDCYAGHIAS